MNLTIRSNVTFANVTAALKQMEEEYGARLAALAAALPAFERIAALYISPFAQHPLQSAFPKRRGSYHAATNAYSISPDLNYVEFASSDWGVRVGAYAAAIEAAVSAVPATRLLMQERQRLIAAIMQALAEAAGNAPKQIALVGPVYVGADGRFSFQAAEGLTRVGLEDIPNHLPAPPAQEERLFKHYRKIEGRLHYREAWLPDDLTVVEHEGLCGDRGNVREHAFETAEAARKTYELIKQTARDEGFRPIPESKHAKLVVEFRIDGMGAAGDLGRRHALEGFLNDLVGWLGLGRLDGGSSGSGTMEAMCLVVDFATAKAAVEQALRNSAFSDFHRVYREK